MSQWISWVSKLLACLATLSEEELSWALSPISMQPCPVSNTASAPHRLHPTRCRDTRDMGHVGCSSSAYLLLHNSCLCTGTAPRYPWPVKLHPEPPPVTPTHRNLSIAHTEYRPHLSPLYAMLLCPPLSTIISLSHWDKNSALRLICWIRWKRLVLVYRCRCAES